MSREEFEKSRTQCRHYSAGGVCKLLRGMCGYEACLNVPIFEKVNERIRELEKNGRRRLQPPS